MIRMYPPALADQNSRSGVMWTFLMPGRLYILISRSFCAALAISASYFYYPQKRLAGLPNARQCLNFFRRLVALGFDILFDFVSVSI